MEHLEDFGVDLQAKEHDYHNAQPNVIEKTTQGINAIVEAVEPILLEKGLVLLQPIKEGKVFTIITSIEDSNSIESYIDLTPGLTAQALGSQITYFRRYTLSSLLTLQAIDDDGQQASQPVKPQKKECDDKTFEVVKKAILDGKKTVEQAKEVFIFTGTQNIELLNLKK